MGKRDYVLHHPEVLKQDFSLLRHRNAFILPSGHFYWAKGYLGCNPSHQIESSALWISREEFGKECNLKEQYQQEYQKIVEDCRAKGTTCPKQFYYLRSIFVHFYGYVIFARQEDLFFSLGREQRFYDYSIVPDPKYNQKTATEAQLSVLRQLFEINREDLDGNHSLSSSSDEMFQKVLQNRNRDACLWYL